MFRRRYQAKSGQQRRQVQDAIRQMERDLNHPSLRVRQIERRAGVWEARASRSVRISFEYVGPDAIRLRLNCTHDQVYGPNG